eukprot:14990479-Ditylum_brightwellii.AAC.1
MQDNNIPANPNWQKHKPSLVMLITNQLLVIYNMTQEVENAVEANRPDIVVLDEKEKRALIIDVTIPMDINMIKAASGTYNPDCSGCPRYDPPKLGRLACKSVTKG